MRVVVLASGRGSNLQALIDAQRRGELAVDLAGVFSDKSAAPALDIARSAGIPAIHLDPAAFATRRQFDLALFERIGEHAPDLIVLAGFMRILDARAFAPWLGRIINIHPSLLPKYPGLHTHRRALESGDPLHGASVHFVTAELDGGPVLAQVEVKVRSGDTPDSLAARLLPLEHRLLVACTHLIGAGRVRWSEAGVLLDGQPLAHPLRMDPDGDLDSGAA